MSKPTRRTIEPIYQVLVALAGVIGGAAFVAVLWHDLVPWALPFGVVMLPVGLVAPSLATYRRPWR